jgi:uncharacterized membrane protein YqjE
MATNMQLHPETAGSDASLSSLLTGIFNDIQDLLKQQMHLFKVEVTSDIKRTAEAAIAMVIGGALALSGVGLLCLMVVALLHEYAALSWTVSFAIVGVCLLAIGAALALYGRSRFRSFNPLPEQSIAALRENLEWTTKPR